MTLMAFVTGSPKLFQTALRTETASYWVSPMVTLMAFVTDSQKRFQTALLTEIESCLRYLMEIRLHSLMQLESV